MNRVKYGYLSTTMFNFPTLRSFSKIHPPTNSSISKLPNGTSGEETPDPNELEGGQSN